MNWNIGTNNSTFQVESRFGHLQLTSVPRTPKFRDGTRNQRKQRNSLGMNHSIFLAMNLTHFGFP